MPNLTRENYYDPDMNAAYMSSHQFAAWCECPARQWHKHRGDTPEDFARYEDEKTCFDVGHYTEIGILEPDKLPAWIEDNADKVYKKSGADKGGKYADFADADTLIARALREPTMAKLLALGEPQVPMVGEIGGFPWKILVDWYAPAAGLFVDLKTARDFESAWDDECRARVPWYHRYWRQIAVYRHIIKQNAAAEDEFGDWEGWIAGLRKPTKTMPPAVQFVSFADPSRCDVIVADIAAQMPDVMGWKRADTEPWHCGRCWWCALNKPGLALRAEWFSPKVQATE